MTRRRSGPADPFTPTFGKTPPVLAGRHEELEAWQYALEMGPGAMGRAALITGARGMGKTVMLNEYERIATSEFEWLVISETATAGMMERITRTHLPRMLERLDPKGERRHLLDVQLPAYLGGGGVKTSVENRHPVELDARSQVEAVTELLPEGRGLLITVDEVHRNSSEDMRQLTTIIQHAVREDREVAFVGAGLAAAVKDLLNDDVVTFLRRAARVLLDPVPDHSVRTALVEPARDAGVPFEREAVEAAIRHTRGYPFLLQLVGSQAFRGAVRDGAKTIDVGHVEKAATEAISIMGTHIHEPALNGLSEMDLKYLLAMAVEAQTSNSSLPNTALSNTGLSNTGEVARRLGVSADYAGQYRRRLIEAGLIVAPVRGKVEYALPFLREHLLSRRSDEDATGEP